MIIQEYNLYYLYPHTNIKKNVITENKCINKQVPYASKYENDTFYVSSATRPHKLLYDNHHREVSTNNVWELNNSHF